MGRRSIWRLGRGRGGLFFGEGVLYCCLHGHSAPLLPSLTPFTLLKLGTGFDQVGFPQRAHGRLQGKTLCFAQRLCGTEEPRSPLSFSFGSSITDQSFQEHESAQRSAPFFGEHEAFFVQARSPPKVTA